MTRTEAKESARRKRRQADEAAIDEAAIEGEESLDGCGNLSQTTAHGSRGVLRHMTEDDEAAGLSWEEFRRAEHHDR